MHIDPPPSVVELVKENQHADSTWKTWFNNLYEWVIANMSKEWLIEVNMGNVSGYTLEHIMGEDPDVPTTEYDIWGGSGAGGNLTWLQTATTLEAISTDANDTAAGTGAQTILVTGLDANWAEVTATIAMNGTSASTATTQTFIRVNKVEVVTCGTYTGTNVGDITVRVSSAGAIQSFIEAGEGKDSNTHFTIPAGKTGYILRSSLTMDANKEISAHFIMRENADDITTPFSPLIHFHHWEGIKNPIEEIFTANHILPAKTDVWVKGSAAAATASIQFDYDILLVDN
jgi:hypothetical protein